MNTVIWWIRRDMRLSDNLALHTAIKSGQPVVPVFVIDPLLWNSPDTGDKRLAFLLDGLRSLDESLRQRGSRLIIRQGKPQTELAQLVHETHAQAIYAEEDYTPYARQRDHSIAASLPLHLLPGLTIHHPQAVLKPDGKPYTVFTPYSKAWKQLPKPTMRQVLPIPQHISTPAGIDSLPIPNLPNLPARISFIAGERAAQACLSAFVDGASPSIYSYADQRNRPDLNATSKLSPYLRFGMLSARQAVVAALIAMQAAPSGQAADQAGTWLNELIWREFYQSILYHFPQVRSQSFRSELQAIPWSNHADDFDAWCAGQTGYPFVDAAMRQLQQSGWMHNRARMVVASFLTKDLLIDWRWGERWFMQHLVDGDLAANNGGWQWTAGTGTDAAPYFRIFNPVLQSQKFDPTGHFIRRWVPELTHVPDAYIHAPWEMPANVQQRSGCRIGADYPRPIVDHQTARQRTLAAYQASGDRVHI